MNRWMIFIAVALLILASCKEEQEEPEVIRPVRFTEVQLSSGGGQKIFSGVTQSATQMNLSFRVSGILLELKVEEGDRIKQNQLIGRIDNADAQIAYQQSQTTLENAKVSEVYALANMERVKSLFEANNVSLAEYEKAKNEYDAAKSSRETAQQTLNLKANELSYYNLFAPMDGVVGTKYVEQNENVSAGSPVVSLETEEEIEVKVGIPVTYINQVNTGDTVIVRFSSMLGKAVTGRVSRVSYVTNESSTYPVFVKILTSDPDIRPGIPAEVVFQPRESSETYPMVPLVAVSEDGNGNFIMLFTQIENGEGQAEKRYVEVVKVTDEGVLLKGDIMEGDLVITAGLSRIEDGMRVLHYPEFKQ